MSKSHTPRVLIIPDAIVDENSIIRVEGATGSFVGNGENQQAGLTIGQIEDDLTFVGDIRPLLSGSPEAPVNGTLTVNAAGPVERARFGFVLDGADADADLQLGQQPTMSGMRPAVLFHDTLSNHYSNNPKLLELADGRLLLIYLDQIKNTNERLTLAGWDTTFKISFFDPVTSEWSNPSSPISGLNDFGFTGGDIDIGPSWIGIDFVQYKDTGEIVAVAIGQGYHTLGTVSFPVMAIWNSMDGLNWSMRSKQFFRGPNPLVSIETQPTSFAIEKTEGGRIVCLLSTRLETVGLISDDRGSSWSAPYTTPWTLWSNSPSTGGEPGVTYSSVDLTLCRNGTILGYLNLVGYDHVLGYDFSLVMMTTDGANWSVRAHTFGAGVLPSAQFSAVAVTTRPNGFPLLVGAAHKIEFDSKSAYLDELVQSSFRSRDPVPGMLDGELFQQDVLLNPYVSWHLIVDPGVGLAVRYNSPSVDLSSTTTPVVFEGFNGLASVQYRGRIVHVVQYTNMNNFGAALMVIDTDHWQPIQEQLHPDIYDFPTAPGPLVRSLGITAHHVYECYSFPTDWGYGITTLGASTDQIQVPNSDNGYLEVTTTAGDRYWYRGTGGGTILPNPLSGFDGMLRYVVRPVSGGSLSSPVMFAELSLSDGGSGFSIRIRINVNGPDVEMVCVDNVSGSPIGSVVYFTGRLGDWFEILIEMRSTSASGANCNAFVRNHDKASDPDWLAGYRQMVDNKPLAISGIVSDQIGFGLSQNSTANMRMKRLALWRYSGGGVNLDDMLVQRGHDWVDSDSQNLRADSGELYVRMDSGYLNYMRSRQMIARYAQHITRGIYASWRGESITQGEVTFTAKYKYPGTAMVDGSSQQSFWRSSDDQENVEIVFDAERGGLTPGALFMPKALAVFGRNWPTMYLELNPTDSWAAIPAFSILLSIPGLTAGFGNRSTHLSDILVATGYTVTLTAYRVQVTVPSGDSIWVPHRFRSREGGASFYCAFIDEPSSGQTSIYKILDNTKDTLIFESNPLSDGVTAPARVTVFADRFAYDFTQRIIGHPGYRFMRIVIPKTTHGDVSEQYAKIGRLIIGQPSPIGPGVDWGWSVSFESGSIRSYAAGGPGYTARNSDIRKTWSIDGPVQRPMKEPNEIYNSNIQQGENWRQFLEAVRRLEINNLVGALAFDGTRLAGDLNENEQAVASDPLDLAAVTIESIGGIEHEGYEGQNIPDIETVGSSTDVCVPRAVARIRGIVLKEEL